MTWGIGDLQAWDLGTVGEEAYRRRNASTAKGAGQSQAGRRRPAGVPLRPGFLEAAHGLKKSRPEEVFRVRKTSDSPQERGPTKGRLVSRPRAERSRHSAALKARYEPCTAREAVEARHRLAGARPRRQPAKAAGGLGPPCGRQQLQEAEIQAAW